ncbi:plasmid IncI1-type surface exclusion protein ExcA [Dickeya undicola]|uniref:plasmid IncI1-type surface exclusion protein ExcA n=1 Tax=Dickeya undicola TaxID=1577887 RepID=UPI000532D235|nr:plasmid IncI1-type surface exclusion protein ExcA [Dickeya undicola]
MKERLINWPEAIWNVIRSMAFVFVLPIVFLMGICMVMLTHDATERLAGFIYLLIAAVPVLVWWINGMNRRQRLKQVVDMIRSDAFFQPHDNYHEVCHASGFYFGIDTKNGTLLYVRLIRRGVVDIVGLTMSDLHRRRIEGRGTLRLYTQFTELPCITIETASAQHFFDVLGAMEFRHYTTPEPFGKYVDSQVIGIEKQFGVRRLAVN